MFVDTPSFMHIMGPKQLYNRLQNELPLAGKAEQGVPTQQFHVQDDEYELEQQPSQASGQQERPVFQRKTVTRSSSVINLHFI